jgi:hypothetical protein
MQAILRAKRTKSGLGSAIGPQPETIGNCLPQNVAALGEYLQLRVKSQIGIHPWQQNGRKITATRGDVNKN